VSFIDLVHGPHRSVCPTFGRGFPENRGKPTSGVGGEQKIRTRNTKSHPVHQTRHRSENTGWTYGGRSKIGHAETMTGNVDVDVSDLFVRRLFSYDTSVRDDGFRNNGRRTAVGRVRATLSIVVGLGPSASPFHRHQPAPYTPYRVVRTLEITFGYSRRNKETATRKRPRPDRHGERIRRLSVDFFSLYERTYIPSLLGGSFGVRLVEDVRPNVESRTTIRTVRKRTNERCAHVQTHFTPCFSIVGAGRSFVIFV